MIGTEQQKPGCLAQALIIVVILGGLSSWILYANHQKSQETPEMRKAAKCGNSGSVTAHTMAEHYVGARLKAPSSAKFPRYDDSQVAYIGDCEFTVRSYVDAQNSFGAMLRSNYYVRLKYDANADRYFLIDIRIGK